ncbi:hypothetical protein GDO81_022784 [Engystomops pustulosus]|uniref:Uncharacterized protein n=1 Tax=Engystomops pustulosus TaxID=76066 RepID=A0AAV6Z3X3_ENGPU|nr:hypothetical protein GDO81_022784 [Engystomops pustulosus]
MFPWGIDTEDEAIITTCRACASGQLCRHYSCIRDLANDLVFWGLCFRSALHESHRRGQQPGALQPPGCPGCGSSQRPNI